MITEKQLEQLPEVFVERYQAIYNKYLNMVGKHIKEIGTLSPTDIHRLKQLAYMDKNIDEIKHDLEEAAQISTKELNEVLKKAATEQYERFSKLYLAKNLMQKNILNNTILKRQINAIGKVTEETFENLSNTTIMSNLYRECVDTGILAVQQGLTDYKSAVREVIKKTSVEGNKIIIRSKETGKITDVKDRVTYESGYKRRRDTAIRMNILDGIRDVNAAVARIVGEEFGSDGVEISAHSCCAPDHIDIQGKQFSNKEYEELQATLKRPIKQWNCHHFPIPIILGVSKPTYTDEELKRMKENSLEEITINGKTKTRYEWTQEQRRLETKVREQKDIANAAKAYGDDVSRREAQAKINKYTSVYDYISKEAGIATKKERMSVSGFRPVKADKVLTKVENGGIMRAGSEFMYRKSKPNKIDPMPKKQLHKIEKAFKNQGGIIQYSKEIDVYLESKQAEAITYDAKTVLLKTNAGRASVFEEMIHVSQYRTGQNDGSYLSRLNCEIAAQKKLLSNSTAYRLTEIEILQTKQALIAYEKELKEYNKIGGA